ncbi:MAG: iron-containing alcohol dehydrogenase [Desulfobacteraceae bacterium]|nr:iron-containing alcohol dehydrogenase [Desulfobacteraceae bacterium]
MIEDITHFSFPTTISFGPGAIKELPECMKEVGIKKPLVITDPGLKKAGVYHTVENILKRSAIKYTLFADVQPNPYDTDVEKAAGIYISSACDGVIGLGGGSSLDVAKALPVLTANGGPLTRYDVQTGGNMQIKGPLSPMIAIPTTAGTGSEVGRCSVITASSFQRKFMICHPLMMPDMAILDPELTTGLSPLLTACTGMDALTHNIEALVVKVFHPMCDAIALKGVELAAQYLERAVRYPADTKARGYMMIAAMMGAVALQKDLGATHSLAHALSTVCNMQHGLANALCIATVMEYNKNVSAPEYVKVARCLGINTFGRPDIEAADRAIESVTYLVRRIGIPGSLKEAGVKEDQLPELAAKAFEDGCHLTNPRPCNEGDLLALFKKAYKGEI